ncbi:MAG: thioredoxin-disulfide reductase [Anaerolineaceae bacterium]
MEFNLSGLSRKQKATTEKNVKVLILGAGPAGMAAALYAARAELEPIVLTGMLLGGQAAITHMIENYPGFPEGVGGSEIGDLFQKQAERFGAKFEYGSVTAVDLSERPFKVTADNATTYFAQALIIATGANSVRLKVPGEAELTGKGVSYCATCDGWFFKNKKVIVVGGGDSALEEAIFLTRFATSVTIVHRRDALRAGAILQNRAKENPKIEFAWNTVITEISGDEKVTAVKTRNVATGEIGQIDADGVFIFIGHTPNSNLFNNQLKLDSNGFIVIDNQMQTNIAGVYAAGEVADPHFRQVVTSAGMGASAAIEATRFLEANN